MDSIKLLKDLTMLDAAPGFEGEVRNYMKQQIQDLGYETIQDSLGSLFAVKKSAKQEAINVVYAGHMDEVGFMITGYTKHGLLKFVPLGGWWSQVMLSQRVTVTNPDNSKLTGIISAIAPHLLTPEMLKKPFEIKDMLIDCGFANEEEAKASVQIGAFVTPNSKFTQLTNNRYLAKAFDNRAGCAIALELLTYFKDKELDVNLYIGATVQEEVGLRGATTSANLTNPDFFIAVDCSPARDTSGEMDELGRLGEGFLLRIHDRTMILKSHVRDYVIETAKQANTKWQYYTSPGGTDAGAFHLANHGVLSTVVGIPARNIHSHSSIIDINDYYSARDTVIKLIENLDNNKLEELK